ncbi:MAG: twin-arginine translocase subunit TatC [Lachnospiraceae bacterium]|nr:twin-arginine translocase subunit TatC [Lachnospiraceae bacterium]
MIGKKRNKTNNGENPEKNLPLSGHLRELRNRVVICLVSVIGFFLLGLNLAPNFVNLLTDIGTQYGYQYVYIAPQELLMQYFSVALLLSVVFSLPLILYHVWAFVQPGMKKNENSLFLITLVFGLICFVIGILFAYKIMLPFMLRFLIEVSLGSDITAQISVQNYVQFLLTIFMIFGIVFELPVVSVLLTQLGLLKVSWMKKGTKLVIVLIFFVAAIITPPDIVSQIMVAIPMIGLYELSIALCSVLLKLKRKKKAEEEEEE